MAETIGSGPHGRVALRALTKVYPGFTAVDRLDLEVAAGEFLTLLGPSGSGKTTTLMMLAGFTPPTGGDILVDGRSVIALAPERRNMGVVFQSYALFPHMTVAENVAFPLRMRRVGRAEAARKVEDALRLVRLEGLGGRMPRQLSGGQQQRVAFARALVFDPSLLLMDEPLGALDKNLREQMQFELKQLHERLRVTIIYVTHDQEEALTLSDRVALMNRGRIAQIGPAEELYERPRDRFVAEFIGETNVLDGAVDGGRFRVPGGASFPLAPGAGAGDSIVVRPEKFALRGPGTEGAIPGRVADWVYVGDFTRYRVAITDSVQVTVKVQNGPDAPRFGRGDPVGLLVAAEHVRILGAERG